MNAVKPTPFTTPDGVERELRFTLGARKRIQDLLGMPLKEALDKYDSAAFPHVLFALLHDREGKPPEGITIEFLAENLPDSDRVEIMAVIMAASSNGKLEKNELEPLIRKWMIKAATGSDSGASVLNASDSPMNNSGGDTSNAKLTPDSNDTASSNGSGIIASESSSPQSITSTET